MNGNFWSEDGLAQRARRMNFWLVKIIAKANCYWYLVKPRNTEAEPIFNGAEGTDWIDLGPGDPSYVNGVLDGMEKAAAKKS